MATKKYRLEDKVDGPNMDLSLEGIVDVPIREMALYRRVTSLDLANNHIRILPDDFPEVMSQLQSLDLSRNLLIELPETFGAMNQIRHLDLYRNKIERLPMSISRMDKLRWLDIKENPLVAPLAKIAGDCLDPSQCEQAAKNLVHFMRQVEQQCVVEKSNGKQFREPVFPQTLSSDPEPLVIEKKKSEEKVMIPRSRTGIHAGTKKSAANVATPATKVSSKVIAPTKSSGTLFSILNWTACVVLFILAFTFGVSFVTGMIADYRYLQTTWGYKWIAAILPNFILDGVECYQLWAQSYVRELHVLFPWYPYIEPGFFYQAYEWILETFTSAFQAVAAIFKSKSK